MSLRGFVSNCPLLAVDPTGLTDHIIIAQGPDRLKGTRPGDYIGGYSHYLKPMKKLQKELKKHDVRLVIITDASHQSSARRIDRINRNREDGDGVFVFFWGHGRRSGIGNARRDGEDVILNFGPDVNVGDGGDIRSRDLLENKIGRKRICRVDFLRIYACYSAYADIPDDMKEKVDAFPYETLSMSADIWWNIQKDISRLTGIPDLPKFPSGGGGK